MKTNLLLGIAALALAAFITSCHTPEGRGAAAGAATGAIVGGPVGAAVGAGAGALVGAAVSDRDVTRYGTAPRGGYPVARPAAQAGFVHSPYTGRLYDVRAVPPGALVLDQDQNQLFRRP